jgi:hypothetical protein
LALSVDFRRDEDVDAVSSRVPRLDVDASPPLLVVAPSSIDLSVPPRDFVCANITFRLSSIFARYSSCGVSISSISSYDVPRVVVVLSSSADARASSEDSSPTARVDVASRRPIHPTPPLVDARPPSLEFTRTAVARTVVARTVVGLIAPSRRRSIRRRSR